MGPQRSYLQRALLLSVALHLSLAVVFPLIHWSRAGEYRAGEVLTLSHVQHVTISRRAHAVVVRDVAHRATQAKKNALIVPHIAHAAPNAAPIRFKPTQARHLEAPAPIVAAAAHPRSEPTTPAAGNLDDAPAPAEAATAAPLGEAPKMIAAALPQSRSRDSGAMPFGSKYRAILADRNAWTYLRSKLGRAFRIRCKIDERGTATDIQIITPSPIDSALQEEVIARLKTTRFEPKEMDGLTFDDEIELNPPASS